MASALTSQLFFKQVRLACLSLNSYMIGDLSTKKMVVVDPQRDISSYLSTAKEEGMKITKVLETHFHADFLSGHLELSKATGAPIGYGDKATSEFEFEPLADHAKIVLGDHVTIEVLHTPGHTPESVSYLVHVDGKPVSVLTGDCLFVGDVGRPDLLSSAGVTSKELALQLYDSLHNVLLKLPNETIVYPGHGAGSACGKAMLDAPSTTIQEQRDFNYALRPMTPEEFVEVVTEGLASPPQYFHHTAAANRKKHSLLDESAPPPALSYDEVLKMKETDDILFMDVRDVNETAAGHLKGSVCVPLHSRFAGYAGAVAEPDQKIVIICPPSSEVETKIRLARIGFDNVVGYLTPQIEQLLLEKPELSVDFKRVSATDFDTWKDEKDVQIVDVREVGEFTGGAVPAAVNLPLSGIRDEEKQKVLPENKDTPLVVYCKSGVRSSVAASFLGNLGYQNLSQITGGYCAWKEAQKVEE